MKPHLKLHINGVVKVVSPADIFISEPEAMHLVRRHYGNMSRFAKKVGCSDSQIATALVPPGKKVGGRTGEIRQMLGLESAPSMRSQNHIARWEIKKRQSKPDLIVGYEVLTRSEQVSA